MSEQIKNLAGDILAEITKAQKILLHLHPSPDPDSVGSALAMAEVCRSFGKEVVVIGGDSPLPTSMSFLPGFDSVVSKNFGEVLTDNFDLFIIQDSGSTGMITKHQAVVFPAQMKTIVIDHHATNPNFGDINLVVDYPATAQILFDLFTEWQVEMTETIAINLFVAVYADTGGFKYPYTLPSTFAMAGELVKINKGVLTAVVDLQNQLTPKSLQYKALVLGSIQVVSGRVAVAGLDFSTLQKNNITDRDTEGLSMAGEMLGVKDWQATCTVMEKEPGQVRISLRSKNAEVIDVSKIAEQLGGGGHKQASGGKLSLPFAEALEKVIEVITKTI